MKKPVRFLSIEDKYGFQYIKTIVMNSIIFMPAQYISGEPKIDTIFGFFIYIVLFSLIELMLVNLLVRYYLKWVIRSGGLIVLLLYIVLIYFSVQLVPDIKFNHLFGSIGFIVIFLVLKLFATYYYEKYLESKRA